jgi:hypothetical protein
MSEIEPSKDDFLSQIYSICTTLTEEAMAAATSKARELGFDLNRGLVSLPESFINLASARATLEDAIEKRKLIQLPITVQREILGNLETIRKSLQGLTDGTDEIVNLATAIEVLNTSIWKFGLHNLSDQVLGYQAKLNQLKDQERKISQILGELERASAAAVAATAAVEASAKARADSVALVEQIKQSFDRATAMLQDITTANNNIAAILTAVQQYEKQSGELSSSIKTAHNDLAAVDGSIRKFYGEVDDYRRTIAQTSDVATSFVSSSDAAFKKQIADSKTRIDEAVTSLDAKATTALHDLEKNAEAQTKELSATVSDLARTTRADLATLQSGVEATLTKALADAGVAAGKTATDAETRLAALETGFAKRSEETIEANKQATDALVAELAKLRDQIRNQLQQATGFTLFGAFQARQNALVTAKKIWVGAIIVLLVVSAGVTIWIAYEAQSYTAGSLAFWVKLSITIPLGFAISFCAVQYGRERRLEEEYAFKSSISVSLNPYRDLVLSILEKNGNLDQGKYTEFVIESVKNVFTPPTERVFDAQKKDTGLTQKTFKQVAEVIGAGIKAAK